MTGLYVQKTLMTTKKYLELVNEFSKVAEYKINIQKYMGLPWWRSG